MAAQLKINDCSDAAASPRIPLSNEVGSKRRAMRQKKNKFSNDETWMRHETAWNSLNHVHPGEEVIFEHVRIAKDGGLGQIADTKSKDHCDKPDILWYGMRPIRALVVIEFIFYNFYFILTDAKNVIYGPDASWTEFSFKKLKDIAVKTEFVNDDYLLTTWVVNKVSAGHLDLTGVASKGIEIIEVLLLSFQFLFAIARLLQAAFFTCLCCKCCGSKRWKRWFYISDFFFDRVPSLASFSAMRLLYYIVPQVATQQLFTILSYTSGCMIPRLVWFIISRACCLLIGLDCFLIKYRAASAAILNQRQLELLNVLNAVALLNQVLGVVQFTWAIRARLFRFAFGGEDSVMTKSEMVRRDVWHAKVCQKIWRSYPCDKAFSILMTWNDDDFQALVLREGPREGISREAPTSKKNDTWNDDDFEALMLQEAHKEGISTEVVTSEKADTWNDDDFQALVPRVAPTERISTEAATLQKTDFLESV